MFGGKAMDWLKNFVKNHPVGALLAPTGLSLFTFLGSVFSVMSDGKIDGKELSDLINGSSGIESLILMGIMFIFKLIKKDQ